MVFEDQISMMQPEEFYPKGDISKWEPYAAWLTRRNRPKDSSPCLAIAVNAGHHYKISLLLAYPMTSTETAGPIQSILFRGDDSWRRFPRADGFFEKYGRMLTESPERYTNHVEYVLFFDGSIANPIGYANALDWARNLLIYQELDESGQENDAADSDKLIEKIEGILSQRITRSR